MCRRVARTSSAGEFHGAPGSCGRFAMQRSRSASKFRSRVRAVVSSPTSTLSSQFRSRLRRSRLYEPMRRPRRQLLMPRDGQRIGGRDQASGRPIPRKSWVSTYGFVPVHRVQLDSDLDHLLDRDRKMAVVLRALRAKNANSGSVSRPMCPCRVATKVSRPMMYTIWPGSPAIPLLGQRRSKRRRHARHLHEAVVQKQRAPGSAQRFDGRAP